MAEPTVLLEIDGPLARITLNRPEVLNAANLTMADEFGAAVETVAAAADVRVVLVRGAGRAFSAGLDLDMRDGGTPPLEFFERQERSRMRLEALDAITVAALHGYCLGGGLQLAIACDLRVCSSDCRLGLPAVNEGIFAAMAPVRLPRLIGLGPARRLILSGELIGPDEALRLGLVDYVVPAERFEAGLDDVLQTYLSVPPTAAAVSKSLMRRSFEEPLERIVRDLAPLLSRCFAAPDAAAAADAWQRRRVEKRAVHGGDA